MWTRLLGTQWVITLSTIKLKRPTPRMLNLYSQVKGKKVFSYWKLFVLCFLSSQFWVDFWIIYLLDSLKHGLNMLQSMQSDNKSSKKSLKVHSPTYCHAFWWFLNLVAEHYTYKSFFSGCCHREWVWEKAFGRCYTT